MASYSNHSDEHLLALLRENDEHAFSEIYNRYWERVFAVGYHFFRDRQASEDIVQQLFLSIWHRRGQLVVHSLESYLARAARYLVLQSKIKSSRRKALLSRATPAWDMLSGEDTLAKFLQDDINSIVDRLPEKTKLIYKYSRESALTAAEIAGAMDISVKTVEAHITRALKTLRLSLRDIHFFLF